MKPSRLISPHYLSKPYIQCPTTIPPRTPNLSHRITTSRLPRYPHRSFHISSPRCLTIPSRPKAIRPPPSAFASSAERATYIRKMKIYTVLILATGAAMVITVKSDLFPVPPSKQPESSKGGMRFDAPPGFSSTTAPPDEVETGTSTIPTFPRYINLPSQDVGAPSSALPAGTPAGFTTTGQEGEEEYQLLGLGIRTVSFLGIQVYVVGIYIALSDIASLQERLIRSVDPVATTLVPGERNKLQDMLLDPEKGEEIWKTVLQNGHVRTAIRIVPTRSTDFSHLRDGWVRGITGRTQQATAKGDKEFEDEVFGTSISDFKAVFSGGRGKVPKGETLLLMRNKTGEMEVWYEETKTLKTKEGEVGAADAPKRTKVHRTRLGQVNDERISRLIWLGYLAGKNVSSEGARKSVVEGCMEFMERPVGTVATQVV